MSELLKDLNDEQKKIVENTEGYMLVLAGAGTGKTRTLTYKVAYLIEKQLARPFNILAVTFTNKAAQEMKDRISELVGIQHKKDWWIGTFHGICVRILVRFGKEIGISPFFSIADEKEQVGLIKQIMADYTAASAMEPSDILARISDAKNNLVTPTMMIASTKFETDPLIGEIYAQYQDRLQKMNALDFDDLIMRTIDLLNLVPVVKQILQEQFKYVLVDESQDLNLAQYTLARILSGIHGNLCIIGDVDQGIYSWRGANINIINGFAKLPETTTMKLQTNYRCSGCIVEASNAVIENNKNRLDKILITDNPIGEPIVTFTADTEYQEAEFVAGIIDYCCHRKHTNRYEEFTILYRTNNQSRVLEDQLSQLFIPYQIVGGLSFYQRKEVKDMLAYIRLVVNPHDVLSFQRIANEPKRSVGDTSLNKIIDFINENGYGVTEALDKLDGIKRLSAKAKEGLLSLKSVIEKFREEINVLDPPRFIKDLAIATGYIAMLEQQEEDERVLNVYELANIAAAWYQEEGVRIEDFIKQMSLISDNDTVSDTNNVVKLMTAHTAKGLEFPIVFIVGMEENIFPHFLSIKADDDNAVEEERRIFYVALTRAKQRLYLTNAEERRVFGDIRKNKSSRFLSEIPKHLVRSAKT